MDADQGFMQKIFYVHVPLGIVALCGFILGGIMGIQHLRTGDRRYDLRSYVAIHLSLVLGVGVLVTGSIWAKASWGSWWVWDEPTLVSFLIVFLLYACYQPLRFSIEDPEKQARYASVFAVTAGAFVPLNFIAVRLAEAVIHPRVFATADGGLPPKMRLAFLVCFAGMALLYVTLWRYEMAAKQSSWALRSLRRRLGGDDALPPAGAPRPPACPSRERHAARQHRLRRCGLPRLPRARADLRRDHGRQARARAARAAGARRARRQAAARARAGGRRAMSELLALGISHKSAPVALRERLAFSDGQADRLVRELVARDEVREAVAISTCNRTEIYLVASDAVDAESELLGRLARRAGIRPTQLAGLVISPRNCDAARQLFRVTAGLESMIVGEAEVQGQVKRAYERALTAGTTGPLTNHLFRAALQTGKRVRTETGLAPSRTSVSTVAVDLARDVVGDLAERRVVIIGAGETAELTARALADQGVSTIFVANRRADRALALAERFGGRVASLQELPERLEEADIVVSSTASPHALIDADDLAVVMAARGHRPLLLIDIAVPRDIEHACAEIEGVTVYDIDDLQRVVARNLEVRAGERSAAEAIVEQEMQRFATWMGQLDVSPDDRGAARARAGDRRARPGRERRPLGGRFAARRGARRGHRPGGRCSACCTSRRSA